MIRQQFRRHGCAGCIPGWSAVLPLQFEIWTSKVGSVTAFDFVFDFVFDSDVPLSSAPHDFLEIVLGWGYLWLLAGLALAIQPVALSVVARWARAGHSDLAKLSTSST